MEKQAFRGPHRLGQGRRTGRSSRRPSRCRSPLHSVIAALIVIVPLLSAEQLPDPASAVKAFFVEPMAAAGATAAAAAAARGAAARRPR